MDTMEIMNTIDNIGNNLVNIDDTAMIATILAMVIDQWASDHDKTAEEACSVAKMIVASQATAWELFGPMTKRSANYV